MQEQTKQRSTKKSDTEEVEVEVTPDPSVDRGALLSETDALLDEIDAVLDFEPEEEPLTFSILMRDGASLSDQAFLTLENQKGETCALGAVIKGAKARKLI